MAKKDSKIKVLAHNEVCKLYDVDVNNELLERCVEVSERYGRGVGSVMIEMLDDWTEEFTELYNKYLDALRERDIQSSKKYIEQMRETQATLVDNIVACKGGYMVADLIESKGVAVDWTKTPINYINDENIINFLADKGYDFNKEYTFGDIKIGFTDYHVALMADNEHKTVNYYNKLLEIIERRDKLISGFQKDKEEYLKPETSEERREELREKMVADNDVYLKMQKAIPLLYNQVDGTMLQYLLHAGSLDQAMKKNLLSEENLEKINVNAFEESVANMLGRRAKMKRIKEFFIDGQTNNSLDEENALAMAATYGYEINGVSGMLAGLENPPALYEAQAHKAAAILAALSPNDVLPTSNDVSVNPATQLAQLGTVVEHQDIINPDEHENMNLALNESVRV